MIGRSRQNIRKIFLRGRQSNDIKPVLPTKIVCQTVLVGAAYNPDRRNKNVNKLNGILFILTFGLLDLRYKFVFYIGMYHSFFVYTPMQEQIQLLSL